jgi:crossover junction endodeoxyribonuclease RuvC
MRTVGIDPGLDGAFACIDGTDITISDMPTVEINGKRKVDVHAVVRVLVGFGHVDMIVLEEVGAMPGNGGVSMFNFGRSFGALEGVMVALQRPHTLVRPAKWTAALGVGCDKGRHRAEAMRLYPQVADQLARKKDDGRADALLLCHWWARARA